MQKLIILFMSLILVGCATSRGYQQRVAAWVGGNEEALLESPQWGVPDKTFKQANGNRIYCYKKQRIVSTPAQIYNTGRGKTTLIAGSVSERDCETCFYLNQELIIYHYVFKGNDCLAVEQNR